MPGVPSGRGCNACRKQKKKCDQGQPSCSRCSRLQIACVGAGQRRYIFHEQMVVGKPKTQVVRKSPDTQCTWISRTPSNEMTRTASSLVSVLQVTDLRYDLTYFGDFLKELPCRLGSSPALDASIKALTLGHRSLSSKALELNAFEAYAEALKTLRVSLSTGKPDRSQMTNTLCAIYLIMICQGWVGKKDDHHVTHGDAIAYLLKDSSSKEWQGGFEKEMLASLCVIMMAESFANPRLQIDNILRTLCEVYGPRPDTSVGLMQLAQIPRYLRDPELYFFNIQELYKDIVVDAQVIRTQLEPLANAMFSAGLACPIALIKQHARGQGYLAFLLAFGVLLNTILRAFDPFNLLLVEECAALSTEVLDIAKAASLIRPVGAGYVPLCLVTIWSANPAKRADAEKLMEEYKADFRDWEFYYVDMAWWLRCRFEKIHRQLQVKLVVQGLDPLISEAAAWGAVYENVEPPLDEEERKCCVM